MMTETLTGLKKVKKKKMLLLDKMILCLSTAQGWGQGHMLAVLPGPTRGLCGAA